MDYGVRGGVVRGASRRISGNQLGKLRQTVARAGFYLDRHGAQMEDPEYRAVVEYLTKVWSARPGRLGQAVRVVVTTHSWLVKAL